MPSEADNEKTMQRLRRLARANGMPDIVCIEKKQLARLKLLAISYLEHCAKEADYKTGDPATDASLAGIVRDARNEIKQIRRAA